jgi:hypothetical protein
MATTLDKLVDDEEKAEANAEGELQKGKDAEARLASLVPIVREVEAVKRRRDDAVANATAQQQRAQNRATTLEKDPAFAKVRSDLRALLKATVQTELDGLLGTDPIKDIVVPPLNQKLSVYRAAKSKADDDVAKGRVKARLAAIDAAAKRDIIDVQIDALMARISNLVGAASAAGDLFTAAKKGVALKDVGNAYAALYQMLLALDAVDHAAPVDSKDLKDAADAYGDARANAIKADSDLEQAQAAQMTANQNLQLATAALALELEKKRN